MKQKRGFIIAMVLVIMAPLVALAVDAAPVANPVGESLAGLLQAVVWPVLGAFLTAMLGIVLDKVRQKTGLQISTERQAQLEGLALQGIHMAEEKAAALVKEKATKLTGQNKLDMAISHVIAMVPTVSEAQADALVHAALGSAWGVGASTTPGGIIAGTVSTAAAL